MRVHGHQSHLFLLRPFFSIGDGLIDQFGFAQALNGNFLRRGRSQSQGHFLLQNQGKGSALMLADHRASIASHLDPLMLHRVQSYVNDCTFKLQSKVLVVECHLFENIDIEFSAHHQQFFPLSPEQFYGLLIGQMR